MDLIATDIKCHYCTRSATFWTEPTTFELFKYGFNLWEKRANGTFFVTCFDCTEKLGTEIIPDRKKSSKEDIFVRHDKKPGVNDEFFEIFVGLIRCY